MIGQGSTLKELNDKEEMELIGLIGNLRTHKMERKARKEMAHQKKKMIAFKSTSSDDEVEEDDEDLSLLVKNVRRMYNKAKFNNRRRWQEKKDKKIICFNCRKPRHIVAECPKNKSKPYTLKKPYKKKALKATWDLESESEEEVDMANVCFMANDNTPKVTSEPSIDDCELTMNELGEDFEEPSHNYDFL